MKRVLLALPLLAGLLVPTAYASQPACRDHTCPPPGSVAMGRLYTSGFETRDLTGIEGLATAGSIDTSVVRSGSASMLGGRSDWSGFVGATARDYYGRAYIRVTVLPSSAVRVLSIWDNSGSGASVMLNTDGTLTAQSEKTSTTIGAASAALALSTWYRLQLHVKVNISTNDDTVEMRLNEDTIVSTTTADIGVGAPALFSFGPTSASGATANTDDVAFNDSQGASQNSWPGEGHVVLLLPTADSAVGTGWTLGTGTAISGGSGSTAVKNTPPLGVADLAVGSDPKQIRNATSNANVNYDATMTTYAAAGAPAGSTITVIDPIVVTAAPVVTSAKAGTVGVVSNPTIANIALGAGGTAGAFWSGIAAGTYSTGWKISHGTLTYAPAVTLGTAPVMRITQVTASTRIAIVCFMGMYVDYLPPGATAGMRAVKQAVNRSATY